MSTTAALAPPKSRAVQALLAIFWGGLLAGIGDLSQAFVVFGYFGARPLRILQGIAGGILGAHSAQMGWASATLGLVLHFTIASTAAAVYWVASRRMRILVDRPVLFGLAYGEVVFLFMYFVVVPLSALGPSNFGQGTYITGPIGHTVLVGLPIALMTRRFSHSSGADASCKVG